LKFDLHLHTYYSDGKYSPKKVVDLSVERNLDGIAITDHDTVLGLEEAIEQSKNYKGFMVIPGIEFGCIYMDEEVHILGYFIDYKNKEIIEATKKLQQSRENRGSAIVEKLNNLGFNLTYNNIKELSKENFIGRVPIAKALVEKGYVSSIKEAFDKYLDKGKLGYVEKKSLSIKETIDLIKSSGGISVLAHPGLLKKYEIIDYCIKVGIDGIECIHSRHSKEQTEELKELALKKNLIITGGSDCHGEEINGDLLLGKYYIDLESIPEMKERI